MKALSLAGALAIAMTFGTAMALAQTGPQIGDGKNSITPPYPYNVGGGAAHVGDGSNSGPVPTPYYSGTGSAAKGPTSKYGQGNAQSLAPPPGMAQSQQSAAQNGSK